MEFLEISQTNLPSVIRHGFRQRVQEQLSLIDTPTSKERGIL